MVIPHEETDRPEALRLLRNAVASLTNKRTEPTPIDPNFDLTFPQVINNIVTICTKRGVNVVRRLEAVRVAKLVDQPLGPFCFLHDAFLVILSDGAT